MRPSLIVVAAVISVCSACTWEGDPAVPILHEIGERVLLDCTSAEALEESILLSEIDPSIATHRDLADQDRECADAYEVMCETVEESSDPRLRSACSE